MTIEAQVRAAGETIAPEDGPMPGARNVLVREGLRSKKKRKRKTKAVAKEDDSGDAGSGAQ